MPPETDPPPPPPGSRPPPPPGLREQLGRTIAAVKHLLGSHVELAKAELADILDEVKRVAVLAGIVLGVLILVGLLVSIGTILFVGETLFGSIGWGVLHGTLLLTGVAVSAVVRALDIGGIGRAFAIAALLGFVLAIALGVLLGNAIPNVQADPQRAAIPVIVAAVVFGLLGLVGGFAAGGIGRALVGLIGGAIAGALLAAIGTVALASQVGAAIAVTVALLAWIVLLGLAVRSRGVDTEALKARFYPNQTIDTTKETIEWVRAQTPLGRKS